MQVVLPDRYFWNNSFYGPGLAEIPAGLATMLGYSTIRQVYLIVTPVSMITPGLEYSVSVVSAISLEFAFPISCQFRAYPPGCEDLASVSAANPYTGTLYFSSAYPNVVGFLTVRSFVPQSGSQPIPTPTSTPIVGLGTVPNPVGSGQVSAASGGVTGNSIITQPAGIGLISQLIGNFISGIGLVLNPVGNGLVTQLTGNAINGSGLVVSPAGNGLVTQLVANSVTGNGKVNQPAATAQVGSSATTGQLSATTSTTPSTTGRLF